MYDTTGLRVGEHRDGGALALREPQSYGGVMTENETATGLLREEHQLILVVVEVLADTLWVDDLPSTEALDVIERCTDFFRLYADACHHGKEEDILFPELEAAGVPREGGPIGVMLEEHRIGRAYVRDMVESLPGARSGDTNAAAKLQESAQGYIDLIRAHIDKEDSVLFMMADGLVVDDTCRVLCARYETVCRGRFEGRTREDLEALAAELASG